jgi:hypothetical protein
MFKLFCLSYIRTKIYVSVRIKSLSFFLNQVNKKEGKNKNEQQNIKHIKKYRLNYKN